VTEATATACLNRIARPDGTFAIVAMDQRNMLRRMYKAVGRVPEEAHIIGLKADIACALNPDASTMLVDPDMGAPAVARDEVLTSGLRLPGCSRAGGQELLAWFTFLSGEGRRRLDQCVEAIDGRARPWASVGTSR